MKFALYLIPSLVILLLMMNGCSSEEIPATNKGTHIPAYIDSLENVAVYSLEEQLASADTVELIREAVFESNEDVFLEGYIGEMAVDDQDRVFIVSSNPGTVHIYVFDPDGEFITKFYREGGGRGESEVIASMMIKDDKIYLLGSRLQKVLVYSAKEFSFISDVVIKRDSLTNKKLSLLRANKLYVGKKGQIIMSFWNFTSLDSEEKVYYHKISKKGQILPKKVFHHNKYQEYAIELTSQRSSRVFPLGMPFSRNSLLHIRDKVYDVWTEDFLIKIYDSDGNYLRAIYYPYKKSILEIENVNISKEWKKQLEDFELPNTWPAIHDFFVDDNEQLWLATITDSDTLFQWFVLNNKGRLKAQFTFPGNKDRRSVMSSSSFPLVKNGYFYARERNMEEAVDRVVKYKIEFKKREL